MYIINIILSILKTTKHFRLMKHLLMLSIACMVLPLCIGCKERQTYVSEISDSTSVNGFYKKNLFDTNNKTELFAQIESVVDSVMKTSKVAYKMRSLKDYSVWDSITYSLYSPKLFNHSSDSDWAKHQNGIMEYLNWHYRNVINSLLNDAKLEREMNIEMSLVDSLLTAQYRWLRSHFDTTQEPLGTASNLKYFHIENELLTIQNICLKELLNGLTDSTYNRTYPTPLPSLLFEKEYHHILFDRIPYYPNDSIYCENIDRANFNAEIQAWNRLITQRDVISELLNGTLKNSYEYGTYLFTFNRLRQLKNEFETYGTMSSDTRKNTLSNTCTYEELITYPNFTIKWNEYLKQFE